MKKILFGIIYLLMCSGLNAQVNPYGVLEDQSTLTYNFVQLDPLSGIITNMVTIPGMVAFVIPDQSVISYHNNRYIFSGFAGSVKMLYSVDIINSTLVNSVPFPQNVIGYQYNCTDSLIYGLYEFNNNYELVTIDPLNGTLTTISPIGAPLSAYSGGTFVLDVFKNLYSFVVNDFSSFRLYAFDINTGTLVHNNPWPDNVVGQVFNGTDSTIYGVLEAGPNYNLVSIDQTTGTHTTIGTLSGVSPGFFSDATAIGQNGTYVFRGFDSTNNPAVFTVDLQTASILSSISLPDNMAGYELPVCYTNISVGTIEIDNNDLTIAPNPANNILHISALFFAFNQLTIYNSLGTIIYNSYLTTKNDHISIDLTGIEPGIYHLRLTNEKGTIINKFIKYN